jgi:hypothetical protein
MDRVSRFAEEVALYERWALHGSDAGVAAAREGLSRIAALYAAALALPELPFPADEERESERVNDDEWRRVFRAASRLPFDAYGSDEFDAARLTEETYVGSICDDIADIYRDVVSPLRADRRGQRLKAVWEWRFGLQAHWGDHAIGAMRALHGWLVREGSLLDSQSHEDAP